MTDFGWTRLAYLLVVLSVLAVLAQLGNPSANPRPLASEAPRQATHGRGSPVAASEPHGHEDASLQASAAPCENPAIPAFARHLKRATAGAPGVAASDPGRAVFYRPTPPADQAPDPVCGYLGRFPNGNRLVFPLPMKYASSYGDTWGRPGRRVATRGRTSWRRPAPLSTRLPTAPSCRSQGPTGTAGTLWADTRLC